MNQTDHHFSKKLRDLEITPSERANELFRSRLEMVSPKRQHPGRYFASAAAVLAALGFLFYLYQNENIMKTDTAMVLPKSAEEAAEASSATEVESSENNTTSAEAAAADSPEKGAPAATEDFEKGNPAVKYKPVKGLTSESPAGSGFRSISTPVLAVKTHNAPEQIPAENRRKALPGLQSLNPEISYRYHSTDLKDFTILDTHTALEFETPFAAPPAAREKPAPLLAKVIQEVKLVVNGEKPDLDRAGVKTVATTFAYNQNGLLAHESRQIKEGVHRFKEIFK